MADIRILRLRDVSIHPNTVLEAEVQVDGKIVYANLEVEGGTLFNFAVCNPDYGFWIYTRPMDEVAEGDSNDFIDDFFGHEGYEIIYRLVAEEWNKNPVHEDEWNSWYIGKWRECNE